MDIIESIRRAAEATAAVANGVRADQLSSSTPCKKWDVQTLMNHMAGSYRYFAAIANSENIASPATLQMTAGRRHAAMGAVACGGVA